MTVNKMYSDLFLHFSSVSHLLQLPIHLLKEIELEFLWLLNFEIIVSKEDYLEQLLILHEFF